jgi:surface carbohydrate biosynthesis protein (TIGR04326 family)
MVWDQPDAPIDGMEGVLLWQSYTNISSIFSIPRYLEDHAERLRAKYLAFIHDLGESRIKGKRIADHLDVGDGFSFWWMTKLAEKSPFKSPRIYDCLRLMALEEILLERRPQKLTLRSLDHDLASAMRILCRSLKIVFYWQLTSSKGTRWSLRQFYRKLPHPIQGLIVLLLHIVLRWPLRVAKQQWFPSKLSIFICSYFIHLDGAAMKQGRFYSRQWEQLPSLMRDNGFQINWLQHFLTSSVVPKIKTGIDSLTLFNLDSNNQGLHAFLDSYLTLGLVIRALKKWIKLNQVAWRVRCFSSCFYPSASNAWLWPILRDDWLSSVAGSAASINCLWFELFDAAMRDIPSQKHGFYVCENQGWERAFLHAWRTYGHGKIIGFQHATVPFWHLYYFDDPRTINSKKKCDMPLPDQIAVNGPVAKSALTGCGYVTDQLVEVEALRYLSLTGIAAKINLRAATSQLSKTIQSETEIIRILILGDMISKSNHNLLSMLDVAAKSLPSNYIFTFKPHPGLHVDLGGYTVINADQTTERLDKILDKFDMAVSANSTSAAVDAFLAGVPVIIGLDGSSFNLSPLRGQSGVCFVGTNEEMLMALKNQIQSQRVSQAQDLFWLDCDLPRWHHLLSTMNNSEAKLK